MKLPFACELYSDGLSWFQEHYPKEYMILLDQDLTSDSCSYISGIQLKRQTIRSEVTDELLAENDLQGCNDPSGAKASRC